jgi:dipeptidyl-peptidase-3
LREHYSALEEARSDLVALYFLPHPRLVDLGLLPAADQADIVRAEYEQFTRGVLLQLRRVREGDQLEEDHMRNRQLVVNWLRCHTGAIEVRRRDGKTYFVVIDVDAFHAGVGRLLAEVQRIKGEGDYAAARALVESYGVHFDPVLRDEIVARVEALRLPSYSAFVMPRLSPVMGQDGSIVDVDVSYPCDLESQMLEYSAMTPA